MYSNEQYQLHFQRVREIHVKIDILNNLDVVVDRIETGATDGSIDIDANSSVRRTCNLQLVLTSKFLPSPSSPIWLNKRFRLWVGIRSLFTGEIVWFNYGIYIISNPAVDIQITDRKISIRGLDKMCLLNGDVAGQLDYITNVPLNTPIHQAIRSTAQLGGETKLLIDNHEYNMPYTIEKNAGDTIWSILEELAGLYMDYQCYYDVNGFLNFNKTKVGLLDPTIWNFNDKDFRISANSEVQFNNIKNHFKVFGKLLENGTQVKHEVSLTDSNADSPFTIEKIGKRSLVINEDKYFTNEACKQRIAYEQWKHTNFNERANITCLPIYMLDVNKVVSFNYPEDNLVGNYVIDRISVPLKFDGTMSFSAYKIY